MSTPREKIGQGCPQRARLEAAEAAVLSFTEPYQKWPLYDAKATLRTAREDYEAAVIAKYQTRPEPPPDYPTAAYWEEVVLPAKAKLARVRKAGGPWADEIDALYASAAAQVAYDALCARHEAPYVGGQPSFPMRRCDTELPPLVGKKKRKSPHVQK